VADNVSITAGSGTTVGTDERTINAVAVQVQRVDEQGATSFAAGQVTVTTSSGTLLAARDTRKAVVFVNRGTTNVHLGTGTVTSSNGFLLAPGDGVTIRTTAAVNAIATTSSATVHYVEEYDA